MLAALREAFALTPDAEITLEANPGTVSRAYLDGLRQLGVNRLSFGVQSSHPHELRLLDRLHLFGDAAQAVKLAHMPGHPIRHPIRHPIYRTELLFDHREASRTSGRAMGIRPPQGPPEVDGLDPNAEGLEPGAGIRGDSLASHSFEAQLPAAETRFTTEDTECTEGAQSGITEKEDQGRTTPSAGWNDDHAQLPPHRLLGG